MIAGSLSLGPGPAAMKAGYPMAHPADRYGKTCTVISISTGASRVISF
jgi:hypothetical protein